MKQEEIVRVEMLILGLMYFSDYGKFNKDEVIEKLKTEFTKLEFKPFDKSLLGYASLDEPTIALFARPGHKLDCKEFNDNIEYYRSTVIHELIHKFLTRRNEINQITGTGLQTILDRDSELSKYIKSSKVNKAMKTFYTTTLPLFYAGIFSKEIGRGANEGYTEWFRKTILLNDENISYPVLTNVFDTIQGFLEKRNNNAIEIMKEFRNGDYNYIFKSLNISKEVGIFLLRVLDIMYQREHILSMIKKYFEAKEIEKQLEKERNPKSTELLNNIQEFCKSFESQIRQLKEFKRCKSNEDIISNLNTYITSNNSQQEKLFETLKLMLDRADSKQKTGKQLLQLTDIKDLEKKVALNISNNNFLSKTRNVLSIVNKRVRDILKGKANRLMLQDGESNDKILKKNLKSTPRNIGKGKRLTVKANGKSLKRLISLKIDMMMYNLKDLFAEVSEDIQFAIKENLKAAAMLAVIAGLGISTGFFIKHFFNNKKVNIEDMPSMQTTEKYSHREPERIQLEEPGEIGLIDKYFKDGISLEKGEKVYRTSYKNTGDETKMLYSYDKLYCDSIRVIKDGKVLEFGDLNNIDKLYKSGIKNDANVMMRVGVANEDGTITYIAWCDLKEKIEFTKTKSQEEHFEEENSEETQPEER